MHVRRSKPNRNRRGFTLLEVLLVLAILGVIAAMVVPNLIGKQKQAMIDSTKSSIAGLEETLKLYAAAHEGNYPEGSGQDFLRQLTQPEENEDGTVEPPALEKVYTDAWGNEFYYDYQTGGSGKIPNGFDKPAIWSSGPNQVNDDGGGDDITNWADNQSL